MAIKPGTIWPTQTDVDPAYPWGKAKNVVTTNDGTGTPLERRWVNDLWGFLQSMLDRAGITPSGNPDQVGASQYMDALDQRFGSSANQIVIAPALEGAVYGGLLDTTAQTTFPSSVVFSSDGNKLYVCDNSSVYQYNLTTAYDITTGLYSGNIGSLTQDTLTKSIAVKSDGSKMYALGRIGNSIEQYTMTGGNPATLSADLVALSVASQDTLPAAMHMTADGAKIFMVGSSSDSVYRYDLTTPWDLSTAGLATGQVFSVAGQAGTPTGIALSADGKRMIISEVVSGSGLVQYDLSTAWDLTSAAYHGIALDIYDRDNDVGDVCFNATGTRLVYASDERNGVGQFFFSKIVSS